MQPHFVLPHGATLRAATPPPPASRPLPCADAALNQLSLEYDNGELQQATRNFDVSMKLGAGSHGGVFKGVLADGTEVAIKVLDVPDEAGFEEEVKVLSKFRHPNLVILMGFARNGPQRSLVYEMLAGGDLYRRLQRSTLEGLPFLWKERVSIALDAACGLSHLHHSTPKVFHRDIKSPNILLDKNGTAKMADFGLACLSHAAAHRVKQAAGTVGYACPLYIRRGVVTEGSEVYSFGMVLLELLTASPPAYRSGHGGKSKGSHIEYLAHRIKGDINNVLAMIDAKANWLPAAARTIAKLALMCGNMQEEQRPNFADMVRALRSIYDGSAFAAIAAVLAAPSAPVDQQVAPQTPQSAPPMQAVASVGVPAAAPAMPLRAAPMEPQTYKALEQPAGLFALECIFSEGVHVEDLPREQRRIVFPCPQHGCHGPDAAPEQDVVRGPLQQFCVGRAYQTTLFDVLVPDSRVRSTVSREHFQVCMEEPSQLEIGRGRLVAHLVNCSANGTYVGETHLQVRGERAALQHGDLVALSHAACVEASHQARHFLRFRLDLSQSCCLPCEAVPRLTVEPARPERLQAAEDGQAGVKVPDAAAVLAQPVPAEAPIPSDAPLAFVLEACGPAVRAEVAAERRLIRFARPMSRRAPHKSTLIVGRAHQLTFWQEVLNTSSFYTLSRQHFEVETWCNDEEGGGSYSFLIRNLSDVNTIHVRRVGEASREPLVALAKGKQGHLLDRDEVVLNLEQEHVFWLTFHDLTMAADSAAVTLATASNRHGSGHQPLPTPTCAEEGVGEAAPGAGDADASSSARAMATAQRLAASACESGFASWPQHMQVVVEAPLAAEPVASVSLPTSAAPRHQATDSVGKATACPPLCVASPLAPLDVGPSPSPTATATASVLRPPVELPLKADEEDGDEEFSVAATLRDLGPELDLLCEVSKAPVFRTDIPLGSSCGPAACPTVPMVADQGAEEQHEAGDAKPTASAAETLEEDEHSFLGMAAGGGDVLFSATGSPRSPTLLAWHRPFELPDRDGAGGCGATMAAPCFGKEARPLNDLAAAAGRSGSDSPSQHSSRQLPPADGTATRAPRTVAADPSGGGAVAATALPVADGRGSLARIGFREAAAAPAAGVAGVAQAAVATPSAPAESSRVAGSFAAEPSATPRSSKTSSSGFGGRAGHGATSTAPAGAGSRASGAGVRPTRASGIAGSARHEPFGSGDDGHHYIAKAGSASCGAATAVVCDSRGVREDARVAGRAEAAREQRLAWATAEVAAGVRKAALAYEGAVQRFWQQPPEVSPI